MVCKCELTYSVQLAETDAQSGTWSITYEQRAIGGYSLFVCCDDEEIEGSPFEFTGIAIVAGMPVSLLRD